MDRYTMLFGTVENGSYSSFGATPGMSDFLAQIGASDPYFVADTVQNILRGFEAMPGYEKEAEDCKPVAVRYAPMHLYKLPGLRSLQQFCALSVSGGENRIFERSSVYTATTVISMEDMLQGEGLNYLDQLFGVFDAYGGRWLSDQDMNNIRQGEEALDLDITPAKLSIRDLPDFKTVARVVESIYSGESVIIRLEPNCGFNRRAVELLRQIYSLLQPRLAIETGFASYQEPDGIEKLKRETSIRIFLVPASAKLRQSYEKTIILDLAEKQPQIESTPISLLIEKWAKLDWETQRQPAMNWLFRDTARSFHDPNLFIDRSERFFAAIAKQDEWERSWQSAEKTGNIQDPTALQAEYESNREWLELLPWGEEAFKRTIPAMMGENGLGVSSAKLLAKCFNAKKQKKATSDEDVDALRFAASYGKLDEEQLCNLVWQAQDENYRQLVSEKDAEIKAAKQTAEHALDAEKAQYESLKKTAYNEQKKLEERITQLTLDIERSRTKLAEQKQAIDQVTEERRLAVEQKETTEAELRRVSGVAKEVQKQNEEKDQALRDKQNKLDEAIDFYQKTQSQLNMTQQELRAAKEDLDKKNKDLEKANSDLEKATNELTKAKKKAEKKPADSDKSASLNWKHFWIIIPAGALVIALSIWLGSLLSNRPTTEPTELPETTATINTTIPVKTSPDLPDYSKLFQLYLEAEQLQTADYTEDSWATLIAVKDHINLELDGNSEVTQEEIDQKYKLFREAIDGLVKKPQIDSSYSFTDWNNPASTEQMLLRVGEITRIVTEGLDAYCPDCLKEGYSVQALFSLDNSVSGEFPSNYVMLLKSADVQEDDFKSNQLESILPQIDAEAVLQNGEQVLVVFGSDESVLAAIRIFDALFEPSNNLQEAAGMRANNLTNPGEFTMPTDTTTERDANSQDSDDTDAEDGPEELIHFYYFAGTNNKRWLNLTDARSDLNWLRTLSYWSTDPDKLNTAAKKINSERVPIFAFGNDMHECYVLEFEGEDVAFVDEFIEDYSVGFFAIKDIDGFVFIFFPASEW